MSAQGHPLVLNEWQGNPYTTRQTAAAAINIIGMYSETVVPINSSNIKKKTKRYIQSQEISDFGQAQKNAAWLKYFDLITTLPLLILASVEKI